MTFRVNFWEQKIRVSEQTQTPGAVVALFEVGGRILAVSRKGNLDDLGLPGGKIDPGETPEEAIRREVREEIGLEVDEFSFCYERVDAASGFVAWCYWVHNWSGQPKAVEANTRVTWVKPEELLVDACMFRDYNRGLFMALGWVTDAS